MSDDDDDDDSSGGVSSALWLQTIKGQSLLIINVLSDGYAYYEEWQHLVQKSDQQVKELLESFGTKCKNLGVCENNYF